jgi:hypothetical protein
MARHFYPYPAKTTTESMRCITVFMLKKNKYLQYGSFVSGTMRWSRFGEVRQEVSFYVDFWNTSFCLSHSNKTEYSVNLTKTPCTFGGVRYWFACPNCYKRVGTLYFTGESPLACRTCWNLSYESNNLSGIFKEIGSLKCNDDIEEMYKDLRTRYYKGKMTKRYARTLKHQKRLQQAFITLGMDW